MPIDSIAAAQESEFDSKAFETRRQTYQSLVGSLGWLVNCTRPDLATIHKFLSSYNSCPSASHLKAAKYVLHYIHSTHDYGISFASDCTEPMHSHVHFPDSSDKEAYGAEARPPTARNRHLLTAYSDAGWGAQFGNTIPDGSQVDLFKYRSMSGYILFRCGGPISWQTIRQQRTSLSSCEAEIKAVNEATKKTISIRNVIEDLIQCGYPMDDLQEHTSIYNDNEGAVAWSHNLTTKDMRHVSLRENYVREGVQDKTVDVLYVPGKINPADIFTKEMKDGATFRRLRDSFMCTLKSFNDNMVVRLESLHTRSGHDSATIRASVARSFSSPPSRPDDLYSVLCLHDGLRTAANISHLCSTGRVVASRASRKWGVSIGTLG